MGETIPVLDVSDISVGLVTIQDDDFPLPIMAICFDQSGKHNIMSNSFFSCLGYALDIAHRFARDERIAAVVFCSSKTTFCVGADIEYQLKLNNAQTCAEAVISCQEILSMVEALPVPTIAIINGTCLGGGLELCLACDYRVADWQHGRMGLPEVQIGVLPVLGGCVRLPRLIGLKPALKLLLTGRSVRATEARTLGLVDELVSNSGTKDAHDNRLVYHWIVELSQMWRAGKLGGSSICYSVPEEKNGAKGAAKASSKSSGGKGTARARLMRPVASGSEKMPPRRVAYKISHLQQRRVDIRTVGLLSNNGLLETTLAAGDAHATRKYKRQWSCWTHYEQMLVYYASLRGIEKEALGLYPSYYLCLLATLQAWQVPSVADACLATVDYYTALALSPEAASLMATFLDVRKCTRAARLFRQPAMPAATATNLLPLPSSSNHLSVSDSNSASPGVSDLSDSGQGNGSEPRKHKKKRKKKKNAGVGEAQKGSHAEPQSLGAVKRDLPALTSSTSSDRTTSSPLPLQRQHEEWTDGKCAVTLVGDASAYSISLLLQLLVAEIPVYFFAPTKVIANTVLSRVRLQMNQQLKYGSLTPAAKVTRLSSLKAGTELEHWDGWSIACCKDMHKLFWDQRAGSTTEVAHFVMVSSTVDADTYTMDELTEICNHLAAPMRHQSVLLKSCCVYSAPSSHILDLSARLDMPAASLMMQAYHADNNRMRCFEITAFEATTRKISLPETDPWFVRALSCLVAAIGKTPVVTTLPRGPALSVQLALLCLEIAFRFAVYGGENLLSVDKQFKALGFTVSPLQFLSRLGVSSIVRLASQRRQLTTLFTVLDTLIKKVESEDDVRVFNPKDKGLSSDLHAAIKAARKQLAPGQPALCKALRSWSQPEKGMATMMACLSHTVRFLDCVEEPEYIDLLVSGGPPFFPVSQGGPLFYGERAGWENVGLKTQHFLPALFPDIPASELMLGDAIEKRVSRRFSPVLSKGVVTQTLFSRRPQGLPISRGVAGLPSGLRRMPWFSSVEAPLWFCLHLIIVFIVCLLILLAVEARSGTLSLLLPWQ